MKDNDASAFRILLDRFEHVFNDRQRTRAEYNDVQRTLSELRTRNYEYHQLVTTLVKALRSAKVKKRPPLPQWFRDLTKRDDDIPF